MPGLSPFIQDLEFGQGQATDIQKQPRSTTVLLAPGEARRRHAHSDLGTGSTSLCDTGAGNASSHASQQSPSQQRLQLCCVFRQGPGGPCSANCLRWKGKMVAAIGARAASDSPVAAMPVNAACDWELTRREDNLRVDCTISSARSNLGLHTVRGGFRA
jgi:hypothetical protein